MRCSCFYSATPTHDEHRIFEEFLSLVEDLIDRELCEKLNVPPKAFENVMFSLFESRNLHALVVLSTVERATDFFEFRAEMIQNNVRLEATIAQSIAEFANSHPEIADPDQVAAAVTNIVQARQDEDINELVDMSCTRMRSLLPIEDPSIKRSPPIVDPSEVERRRQFYVQQRDRLREKEEKQGRGKSSARRRAPG
jgi:hypothetical protein